MTAPHADEALRILYGVTVPMTAQAFLSGQLRMLADRGHDVHLLCGDETGLEEFVRQERITLHTLPLERNPNPIQDALAVFKAAALIKKVRPDIVVMGTPKMGMVGIISARLAGVPRRVYLLHGLRLEGSRGFARGILAAVERFVCATATNVLAVGPSLRNVALSERLTPPDRIVVLGPGTANGIDTRRFRPATPVERDEARVSFGLPRGAIVSVVIGRLTLDKGLSQLIHVWERMTLEDGWLLVVGDIDSDDADTKALVERLESLPRVVQVGFIGDVHRAYWAADILLTFTRREGFPTVLLEASACSLPVLATAVTGTVDAVVHGETGYLVPLDSADAAADALVTLCTSRAMRARMGANGREWVATHFSSGDVHRRWVQFIESGHRATYSAPGPPAFPTARIIKGRFDRLLSRRHLYHQTEDDADGHRARPGIHRPSHQMRKG